MADGQSVGQNGRDSRLPERVAQACAAVAIAIALLALTGWATGRLILAGFHADFIPMSPITAVAFLLLGGALLVGDRQPAHPWSRWLACAAATLVLLIGVVILAQHLTSTELGFENWLSRSSATFGQVPIGRMSPLAAGTFVVAGLAMLTLLASPAGWRLARESAASAAVGVMVVGVLVALGYWRGIAFLSGGGLTPMALPTALGFVLLGAGILAGGGPRVWTMRDYRPVAAGFTVGLAASVLLFALSNWQERDRIRAEVEGKADVLALAIRNIFRDDSEDLENIRVLYAISRTVDRGTFHAFVSQILDRHPNIQAISWSPYVTDGERAGYEAKARRDGFAAYQFTERSSDGRVVPARRRPAYVPVFYQEPYVGNEATLGFNNLSNPARRATLEKARDTGQAAATEPITLVQDTGQGMGILIYQPVYRSGRPTATPEQRRAHLLGFAVEVLHLGRLIRTSLSNLDREGLEYRLVDTSASPHEAFIMASAGAEEAVRAGFRFDKWVEVADRRWRLEVYASPWYLAAKQSGQAWAVLASGLFLTILLGTYLLVSARHADEVSRLADSLRRVVSAVEHSPAVVVITDTTGAIEYVNPKFTQVTGYDAEEVRGQNPRILKSGETPPEEYQRLWAAITAGSEWRGEFHNKKKNGELFWEAASISSVRSLDGRITHFVAIKEDITEWKRNEEAARRHTRQLETIRAVSIEITRELDLDALLHLITDHAVELIGGGQSMIRLWDKDGQCLLPRAYTGNDAHWGDRRLRLGEGVAGTAAQRRQGIIVNDFRTSPYALPLLTKGSTHTAVLAEPLLFGDRLVGVLSIDREADQQPFTEEDRQLLALFAAQAAIAIENARLHEHLAVHLTRQQALTRLSQVISSSLYVGAVLGEISRAAAELMGDTVVSFWTVDKASRTLEVRAFSNAGIADYPRKSLRFGEGGVGWVAEHRQALNVPDRFADERFFAQDWAKKHGFVSFLGIPVTLKDSLLAVLVLNGRQPFRLDPDDQSLLDSLVAQAAIAIENARLHEEVIQHATNLEARVRERTTELARINLELTAALRQAEAGNQAKNDFLINMSHELRTPLNSVLGFTHLLQEQLASQLNPKQARFLTNIANSGQHLLALVNEILDLDTAAEGRLMLHLTKVNLAEVITEALNATREAARQKGHSVHALIPPDLPLFDADRDRIRQIVVNLLSNAVKFTPPGGRIAVTARRISDFRFPISNFPDRDSEPQLQIANHKSKIGDVLEIAVADTGIGIRAEDLSRLFRMFSQLESPLTKSYEGTGVGLALAKRLVELHGGTITAASPGEGQGSTFTVRLPFGGPAGKAEE